MPSTAPILRPKKAMNAHQEEEPISYDINIPYVDVTKDVHLRTRYPEYLPTWDKVWFDPLPPFEYQDPALRVKDKSKPNLLTPNTKVTEIQPRIGSILEGVQLSQLSDAAKDELALLIAERKVVAFPDQDLIDAGPEEQEAFMRHFGKPNYQPVSGSMRGHPGFHIIHRDGNREEITRFLEQRTTTTLWHQDVSYEIQPPSYVMLGLLEGPEVGGDTVFSATDMAYKRLSPTFTSWLDTLRAVHSSAKMISHARMTGSLVRKDAVDTVHPLVRVHPVTGEKCLFVNGEFITKIQGLKEPEQKWLLDFLMQHIITGHDFQARVRWQPRTIVLFDNRSTTHSAIVDYLDDDNGAKLRHIFRMCALGEKPIPVYDQFE
ncbi:TauD-domain-containing protein [Aspergillus uvarum CBS 121591]|uniref:TauD-domain-containing protein n=3 Tax=Aspergillus subgen. Circumdati TaxID=2720871 RepID=A0A319C7R2_9EURO|nr:TauD-domain-containing protein [Aspergillus uvarum CBS 121591]XP_025530790.1 TauD-domain-containing protein [Aspergillus japonicus CBS 114.51]PYH80130.1 TauD-domain-containing protein [Aspergillus uvarum CBS 121591]PYI27450.1 TauD-domain-containing protein [Aspergillus indologenus CBS 114.80]RAH84896.1 TauD-domain-containing protein [Aspergillus japonicus CBS 114.51]